MQRTASVMVWMCIRSHFTEGDLGNEAQRSDVWTGDAEIRLPDRRKKNRPQRRILDVVRKRK